MFETKSLLAWIHELVMSLHVLRRSCSLNKSLRQKYGRGEFVGKSNQFQPERRGEQTTCKPGSVSVLPERGCTDDGYSSGMPVTRHLLQPTLTSQAGSPVLAKQLCPYMVLLRMGFTLPGLSPALRCALTAPFHPYQTLCLAVCFLWHFPWGRPRWTLSSILIL